MTSPANDNGVSISAPSPRPSVRAAPNRPPSCELPPKRRPPAPPSVHARPRRPDRIVPPKGTHSDPQINIEGSAIVGGGEVVFMKVPQPGRARVVRMNSKWRRRDMPDLRPKDGPDREYRRVSKTSRATPSTACRDRNSPH